jgi:hypothetical protein
MLNCILHTKAGNSNYYADRKRGTVDVWHDSQRWVFKQNCKGLKAFKRDIYHAFSNNSRTPVVKIKGQYPSYTVDTFC